MANYIIKYTVYGQYGSTLKSGTMRCKNRSSEIEAKSKFGDWIKTKHPMMTKLVIHECYLDNDIFRQFNDIFGSGSSNPFNF